MLKKILYRIPFEKCKLVFSPRALKKACDYSDNVWVRSEWEKESIKSTGTKATITIIPLIIPLKVNLNLEGTKKDIDFLFVGNIDDPRKNVKNLVTACSKTGKKLTLVGRSTERKLNEILELGTGLNLTINYLELLPMRN